MEVEAAAGASEQGWGLAPTGGGREGASERAGRRGEDFLGAERCGRLREKGGLSAELSSLNTGKYS